MITFKMTWQTAAEQYDDEMNQSINQSGYPKILNESSINQSF
jgi:hypothetical protein